MVEFSADFPFRRRSTDRVAPPPDNRASEAAPAAEPAAAQPVVTEPPRVTVPKKPLVERRKLMRDRISVAGLIQPDGFRGPPIKVTLIDISIAGVRFSAPGPLDVGDKLQIRVEAGPFRWTTRMRVIHCTRTPDASLIGCAFLRTELLRPWPTSAGAHFANNAN
jgi:hypothetical protein